MLNQINDDLKEAMKSGDKFKLSVLRMVKSALQLESISKKKELEDEEVISVLKKQVKQRNDSIEEYDRLGKADTVEDLKKEVAIISAYLPEEASEEEINKVVNEAFNELHPTSMKDMGSIMKYVGEHIKNVDNSLVSKIVKERLMNN